MSALPDAALLAQVAELHLMAQHVAQGALAGMHRSLRRGTSIEFNAHRIYTPGDDVRHIDWRAYAKTDKFHIKEFEDETNLRVLVLLDHSASMGYQGQTSTCSKLQYGRQLAAAIAYLALRQGDAVGLTTFAGETLDTLPCLARSNHLIEVLTRMRTVTPSANTLLQKVCDHVAGSQRKRALIIVVSDLFDADPHAQDGLLRLRARGHDVTILHVLDGDEIAFPFENPAQFTAMEDARQLFAHPRMLKEAYVHEMQHFLTATRRRMIAAHIDYHAIPTHTPPVQALMAFLREREHTGRFHSAHA